MSEILNREAIEQELSEARELLKALEIDLDRQRRIVAHLTGLLAAKYGEASSLQGIPLLEDVTPVGRGRFANATIKEAVRTVLQERGEPVTVKEILAVLEAGGKRFKGKTKAATVRSILKRDRIFHRDNGGWTLASLFIQKQFESVRNG
ncbi:MAG TPA: HTH domain-containing protein [bacterium]